MAILQLLMRAHTARSVHVIGVDLSAPEQAAQAIESCRRKRLCASRVSFTIRRMTKAHHSSRPAPRRVRIDVPVDQETLDKALRTAGGRAKRLRAAVRAFLDLWGRGVIDIPASKIDWQQQRAEKRRRDMPGTKEG